MKTRRPHGVLLRLSLVAFACALLFSTRVGAQKGPNANALSPLEQEIVQEINLARTRPQAYATYLEQMRPFFKGNLYQPPGRAYPNIEYQTLLRRDRRGLEAGTAADRIARLRSQQVACAARSAEHRAAGFCDRFTARAASTFARTKGTGRAAPVWVRVVDKLSS